jgi:hypothetical protein
LFVVNKAASRFRFRVLFGDGKELQPPSAQLLNAVFELEDLLHLSVTQDAIKPARSSK